jgi:DNA-binding GntR family transcriptional regulator
VSDEQEAKHLRVYRELRARIVGGRYGPGYRLVMDVLARELGVSPIPVREAVRRLEADGLVVYTRHVGFWVAERSEDDAAAILEALAVLEGWAAGQAVGRVAVDALSAVCRAQDDALAADDGGEVARLSRAFHRMVTDACPNPWIRSEIARAYDHVDAIPAERLTRVPGLARQALQDHWAVVAALAEGAPARVVEDRMRRHGLAMVDAVRPVNLER